MTEIVFGGEVINVGNMVKARIAYVGSALENGEMDIRE